MSLTQFSYSRAIYAIYKTVYCVYTGCFFCFRTLKKFTLCKSIYSKSILFEGKNGSFQPEWFIVIDICSKTLFNVIVKYLLEFVH